jgi:starch synthase
VADYDHLKGTGTGFLFRDFTAPALVNAVKRALCVYTDAGSMKGMIRQAMEQDFSWRRSARQYRELYGKASGKAAA